ncbi:MAG TPA: Ig-like domain-containing protein [Longimicrobium sp.]|nr:Ig-like domain-containing protein [Longimicrobium sp.]
MSRIFFAFAGAAVLGLACDHFPSDPETMLTDPDEVRLYVGETAPLVSQVLTRTGRVEAPSVNYWSQDLRVARVTPEGTVVAVAPGATTVMAGYRTIVDSVRVTVLRDTRSEIHVLDLIPPEVAGATSGGTLTIPFIATDGYALTRCTPPGFTLRINAAIATAWNSSTGSICSLTVAPAAEGTGYLVATVDGVRDSVRVTVQNGAYQAAFTEDALGSARVGVAKPLRMRILTAQGVPVTGRAVQFSVSMGRLSPTSTVTDSAGLATVTWTPPPALGGTNTAALYAQTSFPTGMSATVSGYVRVLAGEPTAMEWYLSPYSWSYTRITTGSVTTTRGSTPTVYVIGRDVYGNHTAVLPQMTYTVLTDTLSLAQQRSDAWCGGNVPPSGDYYACYAGVTLQSAVRGRVRLFATIPGLATDSLDVVFQ